MNDLVRKFQETEHKVSDALDTISDVITRLQATKDQLERDFQAISDQLQRMQFDPDKVQEFWEQPYAIVERKPDEWYVISPTFVDFQIGWLEKTVKGWNYFVINKYMHWLAQVPQELREKFHFPKPLPLKVFDRTVLTGKEHQEEAWQRYRKHFWRRKGSDRILVKKGHEFKLIAEMIGDGILPFLPQPVKEGDYREAEVPIELRSYQAEAWEKFQEFGALGVYWAFGSGKTIFGIYAMAHITGPKLVVVPTVTLREQWEERIRQYIPQFEDEIEVETYRSYSKLRDKEYKLIIFDECHRLPATTFSRLATLRTDYRIGLSATPYREDGRTDYIFALTGFPVGMDWQAIIESGVIKKPTVTVYILRSTQDKLRKLDELLKDDKKTLIYSYWLDLGKTISKRFDVPFVYGDTKSRLEILQTAQVAAGWDQIIRDGDK
ncbi:MAG: DEAD/DEAH box helicase, partial [Candidatus Bipolaricaulia bacterium]